MTMPTRIKTEEKLQDVRAPHDAELQARRGFLRKSAALAGTAEAERLELHEDDRAEVLVQLGGIDVSRGEA